MLSYRIVPTTLAAVLTAIVSAFLLFASAPSQAAMSLKADGIVRAKSQYPMAETVERLKKDIEGKGIKFFSAIDQAELGASANIKLSPSTLLTFGNPPLGIQFLTANPNAGLDWPVRLLVTQDDNGQVWTTYTDFAWIARRHHITNRDAAFKMASQVIASIVSSVQK